MQIIDKTLKHAQTYKEIIYKQSYNYQYRKYFANYTTYWDRLIKFTFINHKLIRNFSYNTFHLNNLNTIIIDSFSLASSFI